MLQLIPAALYRATLKFLHSGAPHHVEPIRLNDADLIEKGHAGFAAADADATARGEVYRGLGVVIGVLGASVLLLTILPHACPALLHFEPWIHGLEGLLMLIMGGVVAFARTRKLKRAWIQSRLLAEHLRYTALATALTAAEQGSAEHLRAVRDEMTRLLDSPADSQIAYHARKRDTYEHVEHFVDRLTYYGFWLSLSGALIAIVIDWVGSEGHAAGHGEGALSPSLLLLLTAYVPALVATLHGVVSFLRLPQLIMQHERMVAQLTVIQVEKRALLDAEARDTPPADPTASWVALGQRLLRELRQGDTAWSGIAKHQDVRPH
jgi:hypothetical protein